MKIGSIVGARPQFVKAAVVSRAIRQRPELQQILIHTGQHYDSAMSDIFFEELEIPAPDHNLNVGSGEHGAQTGRMLEAIESVLLAEAPDFVLVYGDTNSTLAGALAAAKLHIPVAHIEAGLRSFNRSMPEEINRVVSDAVSDLLLAPTRTAVANLVREGVRPEKIRLVGDVMFDAALYYGHRADERRTLLHQLGLADRPYVLATIHRAENTDQISRLEIICDALVQLSRELRVVVPLHPRSRKAFKQLRIEQLSRRLQILEPLGYLEMLLLEKHAKLIATDSGGVQKEAFFFRVPCVTVRGETEWTELVDLGWNRLAPPTRPDAVLEVCRQALNAPEGENTNPYGHGDASQRIADELIATLSHPAAAHALPSTA